MLKTRFGLSRKPFLIKRNVANTNVLGATQLSPSDDNIFKKRQPIRDSPFSGRIYDTLMKEFDADAAFDSRENIEIEQMKTNKPGNARGSHAITRTTWWLGQGPHFISEVAAVNFEYLQPHYDHAGLSTGLYEYCLYYIPQLRFKNQQAIITESTNETAAPFIQFFFKDGRNCHVDCTNASLSEIKQHIEATFCSAKGEYKDSVEDSYDSNGRHTNPYMHYQNKPLTTANKYRLRRKCICQQPGQYGCSQGDTDGYSDHRYYAKMPGNHLIEDNFWKRYSQRPYWSKNPSGNFQTMKSYIQREEDFRPMYSHENFKNYCQDMEGRENRQIGELVKKIRMNRQWRHVKDINHKKIHNHWSKYFWGVESGLTEDWDEFNEYVKKENANLARDYSEKGGKQRHNRHLWETIPPAM